MPCKSGQMEPGRQFLKVRNKNRLLLVVMKQFAGNAHISFEGDSKILPLAEIQGASQEETPLLKRNTTLPRQDFVIAPLESTTIQTILSKIGGSIPRSVLHIHIEKNGHLEFGAYDNFHPESMFFGGAMTDSSIEALIAEGALERSTTLL